ncbi:MAG: tRNA(Ile)-lysidine synthase [Chlamydiae bacterium]|nr:tRNA(Ile)-lysidine synthase [Chlamydiota bacterium]
MDLERVILDFQKKHWREGTLLLALSGGPDSRALFHVLLRLNIPFAVAHVDHGWREESGEEARELKYLCEKSSLPFHLLSLSTPSSSQNLEDRGREARYGFFADLCATHSYTGVVLGHHADDQAETVLKRVFEGATLPKLRGLKPIHKRGDLTLYRPFLQVFKKEILELLKENNYPFFEDSTNSDRRFLRSRIRHDLLPSLSENFGKEITPSLCRLGEYAAELEEFLNGQLLPFYDSMETTEEEIALDFAPFYPCTPFLWRQVLAYLFSQEGVSLSRPALDTLVFHLKRRSRKTKLFLGKRWVFLDNGLLKFKRSISSIKPALELEFECRNRV